MCLNGFNILTHIWLRLAVHPVWLVDLAVSIPKCDAHTYIYTLSENSVTIMCLTLRCSAILHYTKCEYFIRVYVTVLLEYIDLNEYIHS